MNTIDSMIKIFTLIFAALLCSSFAFAALSVTLSLSDSSIAEGDSATLTATISGSDSSVTAELSSAGMLDNSLTTSPAASGGISTQVVGTVSNTTSKSWVIQGNASGTYTLLVTVSGSSSSTTGSTTLTVNTPANVTLQDYDCDGDINLEDGDTYNISYILRNTGETSATVVGEPSHAGCEFDVSVTGATSEYEVSLASGQTKTVVYQFTADASSSDSECDIEIVLTGANDPEDVGCEGITIAGTGSGDGDGDGDGDGGSGGGSGSSVTPLSTTEPLEATLSKDGKKEFSFGGVKHHVVVNVIDFTNKTATITIASTPTTYTLAEGEFAKKDLDGDGTYDVKVTLDEIVSATSVKLSLLQISESIATGPTDEEGSTSEDREDGTEGTGETSAGDGGYEGTEPDDTGHPGSTEGPEETAKSSNWLYALIVIVIVLLVVVFYYTSNKQKAKPVPVKKK